MDNVGITSQTPGGTRFPPDLWVQYYHRPKNFRPPGTAVQIDGGIGGFGSGFTTALGVLAVYLIARRMKWL